MSDFIDNLVATDTAETAGNDEIQVEVLGYHHFSLLTRDVNHAIPFYEGVLRLRRIPRPFSSPGLWYGLGNGMELHIIQSADVPECHEGHPAIEVRDIQVAMQACRSAGVTIQQDVFVRQHDNSLSAFVYDPDRNLIELCSHAKPV